MSLNASLSLYPAPVPHVLADLPAGVDGVRATLREMVKLARHYQKDVGVVTLARRLTQSLPEKDYAAEVAALQAFVRDRIRYVRDPRGAEMVQTPKRTLEMRCGDCDDKATLLAALLESIGAPARFVAIGVGGGPYSHVLAEARVGSRWIPLEAIVPGVGPGWMPPDTTRLMVAHV